MFDGDGDGVWVVVQSVFQAAAKNYGISNSVSKVGLANNLMDLAISSKLADLYKVILMSSCQPRKIREIQKQYPI